MREKYRYYSKYNKYNVNNAKFEGIVILILGILSGIFSVCILLIDDIFKTKFEKNFALVFSVFFAIAFIIAGLFYIGLSIKWHAFVDLLLKNGTDTSSIVKNIKCKPYAMRRRGLPTERGYKYKVYYTYTDNNDNEFNGIFYYKSHIDYRFYENQIIKIIYYNNQSMMIDN